MNQLLRLLLTSLLLWAMPATSYAQRYLATAWEDSTRTEEVPVAVISAFCNKFPQSIPSGWTVCCPVDLPSDSLEKREYEVKFCQDRIQMTARFIGTGYLEEIIREVAPASLLWRVRRAAHRACPNCTIGQASFGTNEVQSFQVYYLNLSKQGMKYGDPIRVTPNGKVLPEPKFR